MRPDLSASPPGMDARARFGEPEAIKQAGTRRIGRLAFVIAPLGNGVPSGTAHEISAARVVSTNKQISSLLGGGMRETNDGENLTDALPQTEPLLNG